MKICGYLLISLLFCFCAQAQKKKDTVEVGLYVENLYDLNFSNESFSCDYWIWFLHKNDSLELPKDMEVLRNKNFAVDLEDKGKTNGLNWSERQIKTTIIKKWDIKNYPFDKQRLEVETEIFPDDTSKLYVQLLKNKSSISPTVTLNEWKIKNVKFKKSFNSYNTGFSNLNLAKEQFYSVIFQCDIERNVFSLFFKLFVGVFISFAIAISSLFISSEHTDPRFGLPVGALFACMANKYVVDGIIPQTTNMTLVDKIHFLTFLVILFVIIASIIAQKIFEKSKVKAKKLDLYSFWGILSIYFIVLFIWII